jgi:sarcosine oxidase delta subunit
VHCPHCESRQMVEISLSVAGERVTLRSCSACDLRWWEGYHGKLPLADLLELAARAR